MVHAAAALRVVGFFLHTLIFILLSKRKYDDNDDMRMDITGTNAFEEGKDSKIIAFRWNSKIKWSGEWKGDFFCKIKKQGISHFAEILVSCSTRYGYLLC